MNELEFVENLIKKEGKNDYGIMTLEKKFSLSEIKKIMSAMNVEQNDDHGLAEYYKLEKECLLNKKDTGILWIEEGKIFFEW